MEDIVEKSSFMDLLFSVEDETNIKAARAIWEPYIGIVERTEFVEENKKETYVFDLDTASSNVGESSYETGSSSQNLDYGLERTEYYGTYVTNTSQDDGSFNSSESFVQEKADVLSNAGVAEVEIGHRNEARKTLHDHVEGEVFFNPAEDEVEILGGKTFPSNSQVDEATSGRSFSSFNHSNTEEVTSTEKHIYRKMKPAGYSSYVVEKKLPGPMEQAMRSFCADRSITIFKPVLGMAFDSASEAYQFYNLYSWVLGFSIRNGDSYTTRKKIRTMQEFKCQREGILKNAKLSTTRCGCKAMIRIQLSENSLWYVRSFNEQHNHPLVESRGEKKHLFSHKHIDDSTKELVRLLRENNISLSKVNCIMGSFYGSMENTPFTKRSLRSVCSSIANDSLQDDIRKTMESFRDMIEQDPRFVFTAQLDDDDRLKALMWTSGRSRSLYEHFGDVITFDTTYGTNIYKMPFGMFVGVNNHFQSVIFAGVLRTNEQSENFKWAFTEFVSMMGGKAPSTMLTDQCSAMGIAIRENLTGTTHRWCKWHVLRRAHEVLGHLYKSPCQFSTEFNKVVNYMLTVDEFESGWNHLLQKYNLLGNPFMTRAYECRNKWAKPYFKDTFCARMSSTQRSESANHVLKIYVPHHSSINMFIKQYTKLINDRESADHEAEKDTNQKKIQLSMGYPIEKHAAEIYTKNVYLLFRAELMKSTSYIVLVCTPGSEYKVRHVQAERRDSWCRGEYTIHVDESAQIYNCECGLYVYFGVICCHVIRLLIHLSIYEIPAAHILKRWTRLARGKGKVKELASNQGTPIMNKSIRHNILYMSLLEFINLGDKDHKSFDIAMKNIDIGKKEIRQYRSTLTTTCQVGYGNGGSDDEDHSQAESSKYDKADMNSSDLQIYDSQKMKMTGIKVNNIKSPIIPQKKGRPQVKRMKSRMDGNIKKRKIVLAAMLVANVPGGRTGVHQTRFCSVCRCADHDIRKCPERDGARKRSEPCNTFVSPERDI